MYVLTKSKIIHDRLRLPSKISVVVQAADDLLGDAMGFLAEVQHAQLLR